MASKQSNIKKLYWLYIDGVSGRDLFLAKLDKNGVILSSQVYEESVRAEKLLAKIMGFIDTKTIKQCRGFIINQSGGSYMQIRLIVSTVNTLAFALKIKVAAISQQDELPHTIRLFGKKGKSMVLPKYSGRAV